MNKSGFENSIINNVEGRQQLNNKIELAKKILTDSWVDMDAEYRFTKKSAIISALLAVFFIVLNIGVILFLMMYHIFYYEQSLDNVRDNLQKYYYNKTIATINHFNTELDKTSNEYHNYVLQFNPSSNYILEEVKKKTIKIPTEEVIAKNNEDNVNSITSNYVREIDFEELVGYILIPSILLSLFIIILLLRHQKKLLSEVRYFSHMKYQIRLFSNLLDASQYVAAETNDCEKAAKYVEETFTSIREQLLLIGNCQHSEENQNADNDNAVLVKILDLFATQQNNKNQQ